MQIPYLTQSVCKSRNLRRRIIVNTRHTPWTGSLPKCSQVLFSVSLTVCNGNELSSNQARSFTEQVMRLTFRYLHFASQPSDFPCLQTKFPADLVYSGNFRRELPLNSHASILRCGCSQLAAIFSIWLLGWCNEIFHGAWSNNENTLEISILLARLAMSFSIEVLMPAK